MLSRLLHFNKTQKLNRHFFRENNQPKARQTVAVLDTPIRTVEDPAVAAARAQLVDQWNRDNSTEIDLNAASAEEGVLPDTENQVQSEPGQAGADTAALQSGPSQDGAQQLAQAQQVIAELTVENAGLKSENAQSAEANIKLTEAVQELAKTVAGLKDLVEATTEQKPQAGMAVEAIKNLSSEKAQGFWSKLRKLTPKQIAGGVIGGIAALVIAVYGAPVLLTVLGIPTATAIATGIGTWGAGGLATASGASVVTGLTVAQLIGTTAVAGGGLLAGLGAKLMKGEKPTAIQTEVPAEPVAEQPAPVASEGAGAGAETRELLGKSVNINNLAPETVVKSNILYHENGQQCSAVINLVVRQDAQGLKYVEVFNNDGASIGIKEIYGKTGDGNQPSDFERGHIQEGCVQVLVDPKNRESQNNIVFTTGSFEIRPPAEPATETETELQPATEAEALEFQPDDQGPAAEQAEIKPETGVSSLVVRDPKAERGKSGENKELIEAYNQLPNQVTFKKDGKTLTIDTKDFASRRDAALAIREVGTFLGPSSNGMKDEAGRIIQGITIEGKETFYLDFSTTSVADSIVDGKAQSEAAEAKENSAATPESQAAKLNKAIFPRGGQISFGKLSDGVENAVKNWNLAMAGENNEKNPRKAAVTKTLEAMNATRNDSDTAEITMEGYQRALVCSKIIEEGIPVGLKATLDSIAETSEYKVRMIKDSENFTVSKDRMAAYNRGLALDMYIQEVSNITNDAIALGTQWFDSRGGEPTSKEIKIKYAAGQTLLDKSEGQSAISGSIQDQIGILAKEDGNTDSVLTDAVLGQIRAGGKDILMGLSVEIQQKFGQLALQAMGGPKIPTNNIKDFN